MHEVASVAAFLISCLIYISVPTDPSPLPTLLSGYDSASMYMMMGLTLRPIRVWALSG
jgi:hypothetical protein